MYWSSDGSSSDLILYEPRGIHRQGCTHTVGRRKHDRSFTLSLSPECIERAGCGTGGMLTSGPPSHRALAYQRGSQGNVGDAFGRVDMIEQPGGVADRRGPTSNNTLFTDPQKPPPP